MCQYYNDVLELKEDVLFLCQNVHSPGGYITIEDKLTLSNLNKQVCLLVCLYVNVYTLSFPYNTELSL